LGYFQQLWKPHGDTFAVKVGNRRLVAVIHPRDVEKVLVNGRDNYVKGRTYDGMRMLTGEGLLTLEGDAWKQRRRLQQPSFHRANIQTLVDAMAQVTQASLARLRARLPQGGTIEAHHEMMRLTLEVVGETLFGQSLGVDRADASGAAFGDALELVSERGNALVQLPLFVPTPGNQRFKRALRLLDAETHTIIEKARNLPPSTGKVTLLSMLLAARDEDTGQALENVDVRNEVITLFLAGHETTALLLTWGFTLLGKAPDVVARMREEIQRVVGDRVPTMDDCYNLTYVRQVVDEILRLRSPVWTVARDAVGEDDLGGFKVLKDDVVMPVSFLTHRHPEFWPNPDKFDPENFSPERSKGRPRGAYYPFSIGPRICIGKEFSLVEAVVVLVLLFQRAEFSLASQEEVGLVPMVTLRPAGPVHVNLKWKN